jgi:hypothetical protein
LAHLAAGLFEKGLVQLEKDPDAVKHPSSLLQHERDGAEANQMADLEALLVVERMKINQQLDQQIDTSMGINAAEPDLGS